MPPIHTRLSTALADASTWAAIAGPLAVLATEVPEPYSAGAYVMAAAATVVGIILKGGQPPEASA